jgi:hypothetical protein
MEFYYFTYELCGNHVTSVYVSNEKNSVLMAFTVPKDHAVTKGLLDLNINGVLQQFYIDPNYFKDILLNLAFMNDDERLAFYNNVVRYNSVAHAYLTFIIFPPKQ